jgi:hypothetical protein
VQTLDVLYVVGKQQSGTTFTIPTDEEMAPVADQLEQMVEELQEDADGDGFDFDDDEEITH